MKRNTIQEKRKQQGNCSRPGTLGPADGQRGRNPNLGYPHHRVTQMIRGHGCFGEYLHCIGAEETPACQEYGAEVDTAQHVLEVFPRFQEQRQVLKDCRKRYIPDSNRRGTRGKRKRENSHDQILRGDDGCEEDHRE